MKTIVLIVALAVPSFAIECGTGCEPHGGFCACDQASIQEASTVIPSDEKPRRGQQSAWQTGEVHADLPSSLAAQDAKMDAERDEADKAGKAAAGIR